MSCVRSLVCVIQHGTCRGCCSRRAEKRKHRHRLVAGLLGHCGEIDGASVDARRRAGLQPAHRQLAIRAAVRQVLTARRIAGTAGLVILQTDMDQAGQKCSRGQHHGVRSKTHADLRDDPGHAVALHHQVIHRLLENQKVRLIFQSDCGWPADIARDRLVPASRARRGPCGN